ncbi:MAG: hypothetical protein ABIH23_14525 [bacterium]
MSDEQKTVVIGLPTYDGKPEYEARHAIMNIMRRFAELGYSPVLHEEMGSCLPNNRYKCCTAAVDLGAEYILFVDADTILRSRNIGLIDRMIGHDVDIVSGMMFAKHPPHVPLASMWNPNNQKWEYLQNIPRDALIQIDAIGCGFLLIKVEALLKVPKPWFLCVNRSGRGEDNCDTMEDYYFCWKAAEAGLTIWVDTSPGLYHKGGYGYSIVDHDLWTRKMEAQRNKLIIPEGVVT